MYKVDIRRESVPYPLNPFQAQQLNPGGSLPDSVFLPVIFTVEREAVTPY